MSSAAKKIITTAVEMPAGEYYVGDPCYAVPNERWMEWLEAADYENERRFLLADLDGYPVLGIGTAYGDGMYEDEDYNQYPVDAGLIGLVPVEVADDSCASRRVRFPHTFMCTYVEEYRMIVLGNIRIDTE